MGWDVGARGHADRYNLVLLRSFAEDADETQDTKTEKVSEPSRDTGICLPPFLFLPRAARQQSTAHIQTHLVPTRTLSLPAFSASL